ncbi:MAG: hypothetical protein BroJett039_05510 [Chloroflexota bacterium]|nr:MAG: hypothetical protein BroJett039_05510 [Chloroflexota bacterium]
MTLSERLTDLLVGATPQRIFLDTAPIIYFVENNPTYLKRVQSVFNQIDAGALTAITSPITLAECLVHPYRRGLDEAVEAFTALIINGENTLFAPIGQETAQRAAQLRARHNLGLADSFQIATALITACSAFLTNDALLRRVTEIPILVLDDFDPETASES